MVLSRVTLVLAIVAFATPNVFTASTVEISGKVFDCWKGKPIPVKSIDVYVFSKSNDLRTWEAVKGAEKFAHKEEKLEQFSRAYEHLERTVKAQKRWTAHTKTRLDGGFAVTLPANSDDLVILAIGLSVEDELSYYSYKELRPEDRSITLWMDKSCAAAQP